MNIFNQSFCDVLKQIEKVITPTQKIDNEFLTDPIEQSFRTYYIHQNTEKQQKQWIFKHFKQTLKKIQKTPQYATQPSSKTNIHKREISWYLKNWKKNSVHKKNGKTDVNNNRPISLRYHYDITGTTFEWFKSFICNRVQNTLIGSKKFSTKIISHGVPQDSVLGLQPFIMFINDLDKSIKNPKVPYYVDYSNFLLTKNL